MVIDKESGNIELVARHDESKKYTLCFGPNQLAAVEDALHKDLSELMKEFESGKFGVRTVRAIVKHTLVSPKKAIGDTEAGEVLKAIGLTPVMDAFGKGLGWMSVSGGESDNGNPTEPSGDGSV